MVSRNGLRSLVDRLSLFTVVGLSVSVAVASSSSSGFFWMWVGSRPLESTMSCKARFFPSAVDVLV